MSKACVIHQDLVRVYLKPNREEYLHTLAWGDAVEVIETHPDHLVIQTTKFEKDEHGINVAVPTQAYLWPAESSKVKAEDLVIPQAQNKVLKVNIVDVSQGDATLIETPSGKIILVDGGDSPMFARYLAARTPGTSADDPWKVDCILVTHGDGDHFSGLTEIFQSEKGYWDNKKKKMVADKRKQLFIAPKRVYHNGIVKRPSKDASGHSLTDRELLGPTQKVFDKKRDEEVTLLTGLEQNLLKVPDEAFNKTFLSWKKALQAWNERRKIEFRRLKFGDDDAFDFIDDGPKIKVLGPCETEIDGARGLLFLGDPPPGPRDWDESSEERLKRFKGCSASHTINGHSIVFQLCYDKFKFLFTGDINEQSSQYLIDKHKHHEIDLCSEVFKVPHHGSTDFSEDFFRMVSPVISIVSSGDESQRKEYIHPRATLMGTLGRVSRVRDPLVFVTELVAFFEMEGVCRRNDKVEHEKRKCFWGFSRAAYGIVKMRTDGKRLLVYTDSGKAELKEAYAYEADFWGKISPSAVRQV